MSVAPPAPPLVTETDEPVPWTDCTWAAGLMAVCAVDPTVPPTRTSREALRAEALPLANPPGATLDELARAMKARYEIDLLRPDVTSASGLADLFAKGSAIYAVVQGEYGALPVHYRRWDAGFAGGHAVGVGPADRSGRTSPGFLWWQDPLARDPYQGEWISYADLNSYAAAFGRRYLIGTVEARDVPGLGYTITKIEAGTVTVNGPGHAAIVLRDGTLYPLGAGSVKEYAARIKLDKPWDSQPGDRSNGFLVGAEAACLLAMDVTAKPDVPKTTTITLSRDGAVVHTEIV